MTLTTNPSQRPNPNSNDNQFRNCHYTIPTLNSSAKFRNLHTRVLTRIYLTEYILGMESTFAIIAEPSRRAILSLLATSERSVGDIEENLNLSQPSVSKHLRVLREAGFVESRVDAQRRLYRIKPEPLMEIDAWLAPFRQFWSVHVDALERHLDQMDPVPRKKGKKQ
jgi:DNA-binding transcriptional ArsR family regulator